MKPENILYENDYEDSPIKLIDFGTSRVFTSDKKMSQRAGTAYYIAPEVLRKNYDEKCDLWSCGVILYILLCGYPPFNGSSEKAIMENVLIGKYSMKGKEWENVSQEAKDLIAKLLEYDPTKRPSAKEVLNNVWIKKLSEKEEVKKPLAMEALSNLNTFHVNDEERSFPNDLNLLGELQNPTCNLGVHGFKFGHFR